MDQSKRQSAKVLSTKNWEKARKNWEKAQKEIMGFGLELSDSLNRYSTWSMSDDPLLQERAKEIVKVHFRKWFEKCPFKEHICFADITYFSPDHISVRDALTIVFTPEFSKNRYELDGKMYTGYSNYIRVLKKEYLREGKGHTMAPHKVFSRGLPSLTGELEMVLSPETASGLTSFYKDVSEKDLSEKVEDGFFWATIKPKELEFTPESVEYDANAMGTYIASEKEDFTDAFQQRISDNSISEQFDRWVEVWMSEAQAEEPRQLSARGRPIGHLIALPIGYRNPNDISDFTLVSCVFIAMDNDLEKEQVLDILRYIYLHVSDGNSTAWMRRAGDIYGRDAAIIPASHELSRVIGAIKFGLSEKAYNILNHYFTELILPHKKNVKRNISKEDDLKINLGLMDLIKEQITSACEIEAVVEIAVGANFGSHSEMDNIIAGSIDEINNEIRILEDVQQLIFSCSMDHKVALSHAILAMIRNAIRNTRKKSDRLFQFMLKRKNNCLCLILENSFNSRLGFQDANCGKPEAGTLRALKNYVRNYGKDPRLVGLARIKAETFERNGKKYYKEMWQTILPLPGNN